MYISGLQELNPYGRNLEAGSSGLVQGPQDIWSQHPEVPPDRLYGCMPGVIFQQAANHQELPHEDPSRRTLYSVL